MKAMKTIILSTEVRCITLIKTRFNPIIKIVISHCKIEGVAVKPPILLRNLVNGKKSLILFFAFYDSWCMQSLRSEN